MNERLKQIDEMVRTGATYAEVGRRLGVSKQRAYQIALKHGIRTHRPTPLLPKDVCRIYELGHRGWTPREIARDVGCAPPAVTRILNSCGRSQWAEKARDAAR
jgi:hypothetical protein